VGGIDALGIKGVGDGNIGPVGGRTTLLSQLGDFIAGQVTEFGSHKKISLRKKG